MFNILEMILELNIPNKNAEGTAPTDSITIVGRSKGGNQGRDRFHRLKKRQGVLKISRQKIFIGQGGRLTITRRFILKLLNNN